MRKLLLIIFSFSVFGELIAFDETITPANQLPAFYERINGTFGKELLDSIQQVAKVGYRTEDFRYDSVWLAFKYTDLREDGYIWEVYSTCEFEYEKDRTSNTSQTGECKGYNREHVLCQSWFGTTSLAGKEMSSSKKNSPGSDIFHIYPASYGMNSRHGNRPYGEVTESDYTSANNTKYGKPVSTISVTNSVAGPYVEGTITLNTNVLEPADEYKGDFARSCFGTMVKWAGEWAFNMNENGKVIFDATINADTHYGPENNYGLTDYGLALLLKWHRQDPVSQKEVDRNNGIQKTQGNRNPFIDYPYLVEYIWGEMSGQELNVDQLICSADELFELGVSNGFLGEVVEKPKDTIFWMVGNTKYDLSVINHGSRPRYIPDSPTSCSSVSTTFMGWTDAPIDGQTDNAPDVLYTKAADFPAIEGTTYYYAVFAKKLGTTIEPQAITLNKTDSANWTLTGLKQTLNKTDGAYWLLVKDASITSPEVLLETLDSIAFIIRSYQKKTTVAISIDGTNIGQVSAATNTMQRYTWTAPNLTGTKPLCFTGADATASYGVGVTEISLYLGGETATYTNYLTYCSSGPATDLGQVILQSNSQKIFRNGQLYIRVEEQLYDSMGRVVKQ